MLYREPKLLKDQRDRRRGLMFYVSVLYREPKLLKAGCGARVLPRRSRVSVLYREPKLLKDHSCGRVDTRDAGFSALP